MTTTSKKFSDDLNPEIPRERIIDALKSSNKLDAAQANATYRLRNEIKEHQRQMGASHDALSDQIDKKITGPHRGRVAWHPLSPNKFQLLLKEIETGLHLVSLKSI